MGRPVSFANCSLMCLVGLGVCEKAVLRISSCLALIVVRGPLRFEPTAPSPSGLLFSVCESLVSGSPSNEPCNKNTPPNQPQLFSNQVRSFQATNRIVHMLKNKTEQENKNLYIILYPHGFEKKSYFVQRIAAKMPLEFQHGSALIRK